MQERIKMLSRGDILKWISETVDTSVRRIEDLGDGVCYCLLMVHYYGSKILSESSINRNPNTQSDILGNFRQLQNAFTRLKIFRLIDVHKLAKMKYQDNWEFACYLYRLLNKTCNLEMPSMVIPKALYENSLMMRGSGQVTPINGKSSVSSQLFSSNYVALIDRLKEILIKDETDHQKVRQLRLLLNVKQKPSREESIDAEIKQLITDEKATVEQIDVAESQTQLKF